MEKFLDMEGKTPFIKEVEKYRGTGDNGMPESDRRFAARMGVSPSMLKHWHTGSVKPSLETVAYKVFPGLKLTPEQGRTLMLLAAEVHGVEVDITAAAQTPEDERANVKIAAKVVEGEEFIRAPERSNRVHSKNEQLPTKQSGCVSQMFSKTWLQSFCSSADNVFFLDIEDDLMSPTILQYDSVMVDAGQKIIRDDKIYAVIEGVRVVVRRLRRTRDGVKVVLDNPQTKQPRSADQKEGAIRVVGQVVWVGRILV